MTPLKLKYKLRNKITNQEVTNIHMFEVKQGEVVSVTTDIEVIEIDNKIHEFSKFLETIGGVDIYDGDRAIVDLANFEAGEIVVCKNVEGQFRELYEEGLYYFCMEDMNVPYCAYDTKIVEIL